MADSSPVDIPALFRLDGQVAIVTGASSGLGDRFARVLVAAGATVIAGARRIDRLESLAEELGEHLVPVACDVTDESSTAALVATAIERFGAIDVLVNNAGAGTTMPAESEPMEQFRATIDVNLTGLFCLTQQTARHMLEAQSGSIINIASILGLDAGAPIKQASYCASKGAVVNLTRELGVQWARKGVRVNAIAPGWFPTEMTQDDMFEDGSGMAYLERNCPQGRGGELAELDGALLFLAGSASSYVCGHILTVDGGWTAR